MEGHHQRSTSEDAGQVRDRLEQLYGANRFAFLGDDRQARARLDQFQLPGASIVQAAFSTGFRIDMEGTAEERGSLGIFLRARGSVDVRTDTGSVQCQAGQWIPFSAGTTRAVSSYNDLQDVAILLGEGAVASALQGWLGGSPDEALRLDPFPFSADLAARWTELVTALRALARMGNSPPRAVRDLLDYGITLILDGHPHNFSNYRRGAVPGRLDPDQVAMLHSYVADSLDTKITVAALAGLVGMGTTKFFAAFRDAFGTTPTRFVRRERLRRAQWLLENSRMSIADIAAATGFAGQSHLTVWLLEETGMTPHAYRRRNGNPN